MARFDTQTVTKGVLLRRCPFCGGKAVMVHDRTENGLDGRAQCSKCGIYGRMAVDKNSDMAWVEQEAADCWNERYRDAAAIGRLGGKRKVPKGFAGRPDLRAKAQAAKRAKKLVEEKFR